MIHTEPLAKALAALEDILKQPYSEYIRDGAIQRFEFTFELSWKLMQRLLKDRGVESGSPNQVLRAAFKEGLIDNLDDWLNFLKSRNLTVHTYNQQTAEEVYTEAKRFPPYAKKVLKVLQKNA